MLSNPGAAACAEPRPARHATLTQHAEAPTDSLLPLAAAPARPAWRRSASQGAYGDHLLHRLAQRCGATPHSSMQRCVKSHRSGAAKWTMYRRARSCASERHNKCRHHSTTGRGGDKTGRFLFAARRSLTCVAEGSQQVAAACPGVAAAVLWRLARLLLEATTRTRRCTATRSRSCARRARGWFSSTPPAAAACLGA